MRMSAAPLALGVVLLAACGGSDLESEDPNGYEACALLSEAVEITDDPLMRIGALSEAAGHAGKAATAEIRESVDQVGGMKMADSEALADACESNGVEIP